MKMPRKYSPAPGAKTRKRHNVRNIERAVRAVRGGYTLREAEKRFDVARSIIHRRLHSKGAKSLGGQPVLSREFELSLVNCIETCGEWGYPLSLTDIRIFVKLHLDRRGVAHAKFKNNYPGIDWARSFIKRHRRVIKERISHNINRSRARVGPTIVREYFDELGKTIDGIPSTHILNYDETNLSDDPGKPKLLFKRGTKHPVRVMNFSKSSTSIMFCATASGDVLPPYVIYKASLMYSTWTEGGPRGTRYNRTKSGWMDATTFEDWFETIVIPYIRRLPLEDKKLIIGDNLSSHLSVKVIALCEEYNVAFTFLPPNSTHITQPLDVAFFRPMKGWWRGILSEWKLTDGRYAATVQKDVFPKLLSSLMKKMRDGTNGKKMVVAGFKATGISPFNPNAVLKHLPAESESVEGSCVDSELVHFLKESRYNVQRKVVSKKKINVLPGRSVSVEDFESHESEESNEETDMESDSESEVQSEVDSELESDVVDNDDSKSPEVAVSSWVMVDFGKDKSGRQVYIGQVQLIESDIMEGQFLRPYRSHKDQWVYPTKADNCQFSRDDIVKVLEPPRKLRRGILKFLL